MIKYVFVGILLVLSNQNYVTAKNLEIQNVEDYLVNLVVTIVLNDYVRHNEKYNVNLEGVVLNDQYILTTAENLRELAKDRSNLKSLKLVKNGIDLKNLVEKVIVPNRGDFDKDIALIKLKPEAKLLKGKPVLFIPDSRPTPATKAVLYALMEADTPERTVSVRKFNVDFANNEQPNKKEQLYIHRIPEAWKIHIFGGPLVVENELVGIYIRQNEVADASDDMNDYVFEDLTAHKTWIKKTISE